MNRVDSYPPSGPSCGTGSEKYFNFAFSMVATQMVKQVMEMQDDRADLSLDPWETILCKALLTFAQATSEEEACSVSLSSSGVICSHSVTDLTYLPLSRLCFLCWLHNSLKPSVCLRSHVPSSGFMKFYESCMVYFRLSFAQGPPQLLDPVRQCWLYSSLVRGRRRRRRVCSIYTNYLIRLSVYFP